MRPFLWPSQKTWTLNENILMIQRLKFYKISWLFLCQFLFLRENPREFRENNKQIIRTTDKCRNPDSPNLICSGHGTCECDKCKCNEDDDGQYTGMPRIIHFLKVDCLITWLIFQTKMTTFSPWTNFSETSRHFVQIRQKVTWQSFFLSFA